MWLIVAQHYFIYRSTVQFDQGRISASNLMNPVFHSHVAHAFVQSVGWQHQDEVACSLYTRDQLLLEPASFQFLHVDEDTETTQL